MLIAADCETGGLNAAINPILSLALYTPEHEFYVQIKGDRKWCDAKALEINGLNPDEGVSKIEATTKLIEFWTKLGCPKFTLIGHNVGPFDVPFIKQLGIPSGMIDYHYFDSLVAVALLRDCGKIDIKKLNLAACCTYFGIEAPNHNALTDARASWELWHKCLGIINPDKQHRA